MKTVDLYSYDELTPEAKDRAKKTIIEDMQNDPYLMEPYYQEMKDSMQAIATAAGVKTLNYQYGVQSCQWRVSGHGYWIDEHLAGARALAHFLNVLMKVGYDRPRHFSEMKFPGICGFTGMSYDDDICESIWDSLLQGETIKTAFDRATGTICQILQKEYEYLTSEESGFYEDEAFSGGECWTVEGEKY